MKFFKKQGPLKIEKQDALVLINFLVRANLKKLQRFRRFLLKNWRTNVRNGGDEMFGKWETKCSAFRRTKVRRKSPAAYQEAQIKKKNT